ncbi:hypothetical protein [Xanthobacter sediminis]
MTDSTSIADRLSALRADLSAGRPQEAARAAVHKVTAAAGADLADAEAWVRAHPFAAAGLCLLAGAIVGGLWKRGRGQ